MVVKKKNKWLPIVSVLGVIVLLLVTYFGVVKYKEIRDTTGEEDGDQVVLLDMDVSVATKLYYKDGTNEVTLIKEEDTWKAEEDETLTLNQTYITNMLDVFQRIEATTVVSETRENVSEYGLDSPSLTVTLTIEDGTEITYQIGDQVITSSGGYYATVVGNEGIYVVDETLKDAFTYSVEDMVEEEVEETTEPTVAPTIAPTQEP